MSSVYSWVTYRDLPQRTWQRSDPQLNTRLLNPDGCCCRRATSGLFSLLCIYVYILGRKNTHQIPTETNTFLFPQNDALSRWGWEGAGMLSIWLVMKKPPASRPNQLKMRLHTHTYIDFVPRTCQAAEALSVSCFQTFSYKWHAIRYDR